MSKYGSFSTYIDLGKQELSKMPDSVYHEIVKFADNEQVRWNEIEIPVTVEYAYYPPYRGSQYDPPHGATIEDVNVVFNTRDHRQFDVTDYLTNSTIQSLVNAIEIDELTNWRNDEEI